MRDRNFRSFSEFWPHYVLEHRHPVSRALHVSGTLLALITLGAILQGRSWRWLWLCLVFGYGFAWLGHFAFERNRPATFRHPLYSLWGDFVMLYKSLTFQMARDLQKAERSQTVVND